MTRSPKLPKEILEFFRNNGRLGGHARAAKMSPSERSEQARRAVQVRWERQAAKPIKAKGKK